MWTTNNHMKTNKQKWKSCNPKQENQQYIGGVVDILFEEK
jgi:hypothetical protein